MVTGVAGGTEPIVLTCVCGVVPARAVSRGRNSKAVDPTGGTAVTGATTVAGAIVGLNGRTVS